MRENTRSNKIISERKPENKEEIMKKKIVAIALSDAVSGQPKTYEPNEDGVYEIKVDFPSASGLTFKLDPATDKVTA